MSSAYLRLLTFLLVILIPPCASSSPAFNMMSSAYKLNKQGDNIQPWHIPFSIWNQSVVLHLVLTCFLTCIQISQEYRPGGLVFPSLSEFSTVYCDPPSQRLWCSQLCRNRCLSGTLLLFSMIQWMLAIWSLVPLPFPTPSWTSGSSWFTYC